MPLYEYQCDACGHRFEVIQKMSAGPPEKCPACGGIIHKMQSAPAIQFKGTGWYVTDYAKKDHSGPTQTDGGSQEGSKESAERGDTSDRSDKSKGSKDSKDATKSTTSGDAAPPTSAGASTPTKTP